MNAPFPASAPFQALRLCWLLTVNGWVSRRQRSGVRQAEALAKPIGLGLIVLSLGFASVARAEAGNGAVNFNLPAPPATTSDASSSATDSTPSSPPAAAEAVAPAADAAPVVPSVAATESAPAAEAAPPPTPTPTQSSIVSFALPAPFIPAPPPPSNPPPAPAAAPVAPAAPTAPATAAAQTNLFAGGSDSLVARTVGHAEGTRTPDGSKTRAYQGHVDPGNGVWNLGSFSFQHCREYNCSTPEQADEHQLKRLQGQAEKLIQKTTALGIEMSLLEELNGIDLANQAPLAALGSPGYSDWLKQARNKGLTGSEAVLWARVQSYWDPARNGWNAPGLGNSEDRISYDQNRRLSAIVRALDVYQQQVAAGKISSQPKSQVAAKPNQEKTADRIIFQDLQ
jgi:hypothetical protein